MNISHAWFFLCLLLQLISFRTRAQEVKKYDIIGKLNTNYNGLIYLRYDLLPDSPLSYQTTVVNGNFYFKIDLLEPVVAVLSLPPPTRSDYMYVDTSTMTINANIDSTIAAGKSITSLRIVNVEGSKSQTIYSEWMASWTRISESGLSQKIQSDYLFGSLDSLVKLYPDHNIVTQALFFSEILSYDQALKIYNQLSIRQQNRSNVNGISKLLARLKRTDIGTTVALKDLKNEIGEPVTLQSTSSSVTLLDFWASWCSPCRAMHPDFKKLYAKYHSRGFNIISISLDNDRNKWLKAIGDDGINWINASDMKGYSGYMASYYGLNYIPFNLLIDEHLQILGKNVTPNEMEIILDDKLNKPAKSNE
ncbi:MAG: AhpC/TSA family protein [Bacteroidetes bacterium]|nr:MAG: AhpC/TSA family protein [Bacteroidota bacterium]